LNFVPVEHKISELLIKKYRQIKRDLPWRHTKDPYLIWLSEVILQQTRVAQGLPYYLKMAERFPDVVSLASAKEDEVLKLWQGLGYYSRARNMHATAREVVLRFNGQFPHTYHELISLRGVGDYTASAVASFSSDECAAVVDGNVIRVLSRLFAISTSADSVPGKRLFKELATEILNKKYPGLHNQALMEFGALVCTPRNPACASCDLAFFCEARITGDVMRFPVKKEKKKPRDRFFTFVHFRNQGITWIDKRDDAEIWKGLYQFPLLETDRLPHADELKNMIQHRFGLPENSRMHIFPLVKHLLSHQKLHIRFVTVSGKPGSAHSSFISVDENALDQYPFPVVIANYLGGR
jgi:A/G-specific adenine glycosylase